jgi:predicted TIM-barrel fold metal-dependent hydrolase
VEAAVTCSWNGQEPYRALKSIKFLYGMILPCPNGIVPYGGPKCFENGQDFPDINYVKQQMRDRKIDFLGELLNQYYGISMSDSIMLPYYALAQEFNIPIAIHTGLAGPDHGCPNFDPLMGDPKLLEPALKAFPGLRVWLMHAGAPYIDGTLNIMSTYKEVYADISVIANPAIIPMEAFAPYMKTLIDAGLEDRLMFGSDGGDIAKMIDQVNNLDFLTLEQKEKIFFKNAKRFFGTK